MSTPGQDRQSEGDNVDNTSGSTPGLGIVRHALKDASERLSRSKSAVVGKPRGTTPGTTPGVGAVHSAGGSAAPARSPSASAGPRRLFSLNRKTKDANATSDGSQFFWGDAGPPPPEAHAVPASATPNSTTPSNTSLHSSYPPSNPSSISTARLGKTAAAADADDPFIRPRSPSAQARAERDAQQTHNSSYGWDGYASMRAGTQTLIQALQAIPWSEDADNDVEDEAQHDPRDYQKRHGSDSADEDDDDDDEGAANLPMYSSIHTIHRPVARSKRTTIPTSFLSPTGEEPIETTRQDDTASSPSDDDEEGLSSRIEEAMAADFEHRTPAPRRLEKPEDTQEAKTEGVAAIMDPRAEVATDGQVGGGKDKGKGKGRREATIIDVNDEEEDGQEEHRAEGARQNAAMRSGTMGTVRMKRRAALAEKLRDIFEVPGIEEVIAEMPCWLLRSIMLQGFMYLTNSYLCFFAHLPAKEDQVLKSGFLTKRATRTRRWIKHWFVLKNDALSWYHSSADPYFPHGVVDLRYAVSIEAAHDRDIRIRTNQKTVALSAESVASRDEWVKALRRVMFKAQHTGDSVRVAIPYAAILDVEKSTAMDFSETIEVKVVDQVNSFEVDSYFFAYLPNLGVALEQIREAVRSHREHGGFSGGSSTKARGLSMPLPVMDTTQTPRSPAGSTIPLGQSPNMKVTGLPTTSSPIGETDQGAPRPSAISRLSSLWQRTPAATAPASSKILQPTTEESESASNHEEFTHINKRGESSFVPVTMTTSPGMMSKDLPPVETATSPEARLDSSSHTYPPSPTPSETLAEASMAPNSGSALGNWGVGMPSWLRIARPASGMNQQRASSDRNDKDRDKERMSTGEILRHATGSSAAVSAMMGPTGLSMGSGGHELGYSVLETPGLSVDGEMQEKFRATFALGEEESLLGYFPGFIYRVIPVPGRLYVSTNYFCFKSTGPLASRTRMIIPIKDILSTEASQAWALGHHGLVVNLRGYEELFFEFSHVERRTAVAALLDHRKEKLGRSGSGTDTSAATGDGRTALIYDDFEPGSSSQNSGAEPSSASSDLARSLDPMFTSTSSTFLRFKPAPLHFTFLTIGSRGDVQPYIALAKGLLADGHRCKIATHGEFKDWIEGQGIEYGYVGGDPAELMRLSVENGMFTVSFIKEGLQKFRGWIDDLLKTSWEACQGTDVLVESPSAMAGYHIAEALQIPYFRAFTMTWTRTRAYPHAFAVPDHKRGGNYNYMSYVLFDQVFWRAIAGQINRWRRKTLGLRSTSLDLMEPHKTPFLYNFSPTVVPPPLDWPDWIRITGYWFLDAAEVSNTTWTPPADVVAFIDGAHAAGKKVVYVGFGSIVVSDPQAMTKVVVEAIVRSGVYAILSKGWSDRLQTKGSEASEPEPPLPKQIFPVSSIPHDWLFTRIDAACHHGGAGTTGASLRAGIPTIIRPFFGDQFFWADRVEALGIGSGVRKLTVEALTEAFVSATTDLKQVERARVIGAQIRSENGVTNAIQALYRDMDYARSLIKVKTEHTGAADDAENATIRDSALVGGQNPGSPPPDSEWTVIEDSDGPSPRNSRRPSFARRKSSGSPQKPERLGLGKRQSLVANVMSAVLPGSLTSPTLARKSPL